MAEMQVRTDAEAMGLAIRAARQGIEEGQSPFGCCIVKQGRVIAQAHNLVWERADPTAHAEVIAIRAACESLGTIDLSGCTLYATCEPCPMCFAAAHWARISKLVFGAGIEDAVKAGFNELRIGTEQMKQTAGDSIEMEPGVMAEECRELFQAWARAGKSQPY